MSNFSNQLDNELADATDAILSGREVGTVSAENAELVRSTRELAQVIDPNAPPSAAFQQRLTQRLNAEWDRANPSHSNVVPLRLLDRPVVRLVSMAAAVVLVLGALVVLAVPESDPQLQATAIPLDDAAAVLVLLGVAAVGAAVYWRGRR